MRLFDRKCDLVVGDLRVTGLRIAFQVEKSLRALPNSVEIKVYNLSPTSRSRIEAAASGRESIRTQLLVGFGDNLWQLFVGDLREAKSKREGADVITTLSGVDGGNAARTGRTSRTFPPNASVGMVLSHLAETLEAGIGNALEAFSGSSIDGVGRTFPRGTSVHGNAAEALSGLCLSAGLEWSIQNGLIQVLEIGRAIPGRALRLTPQTGLYGSPTISNRGVVSGSCAIVPDATPGRLFTIESEFVNGTFRFDKTNVQGDTRGADWKIDFEGRRPT